MQEQAAQYDYGFKELIGIPFKPLVGIRAPALGIEIGLKNKDDWERFVQPVMQALVSLSSTMKEY